MWFIFVDDFEYCESAKENNCKSNIKMKCKLTNSKNQHFTQTLNLPLFVISVGFWDLKCFCSQGYHSGYLLFYGLTINVH